MGIVVIGPVFVDIKGYPLSTYIPAGRNSGTVEYVHGGVSRNIVEDIANIELRPTFLSLVDDSALGSEVMTHLARHKVETKYMKQVKDGMGTWLAIFDNSGDVVAAISKRPDFSAILSVLEESGDEIFSTCDSVSLEIDTDKKIVKKVLSLAEKYGKKVYGVISNMSIAIERRDFFKDIECLVCNKAEMGILFSENYENIAPDVLSGILLDKIKKADIKKMIVTVGAEGAVYADSENDICGCVPPLKVDIKDTTGAGDAFFAGACIGLTYGKTLEESCNIGTRLAAAVIPTTQNVCPRFRPEELGINI